MEQAGQVKKGKKGAAGGGFGWDRYNGQATANGAKKRSDAVLE